MANASRSGQSLLLKVAPPAADATPVRVGVTVVAATLGLVAAALASLPLVLHARRPIAPPVFQGSTTIWSVPLAGGRLTLLRSLHGQWGFPEPTLDGSGLILERPQLTHTEVWRVPFRGAPTMLQSNYGPFRPPVVWNGGYLARERESRTAAGYRIDLRVFDRELHTVWTRRMPFPLGFPSVSADGRRVALLRMRLLELVTPTSHRVLARDATGFAAPLWTRDGRSLLYWNNRGALVLRDVATGATRTLVRGRHFDAVLSPDGATAYVLGLKNAVSIPK